MTSVQLVNPVGSGARTVQTGEGSYRRLRAGGAPLDIWGGGCGALRATPSISFPEEAARKLLFFLARFFPEDA